MDPNETLFLILEKLHFIEMNKGSDKTQDRIDISDLEDYIGNLYGWIRRGGHIPTLSKAINRFTEQYGGYGETNLLLVFLKALNNYENKQ